MRVFEGYSETQRYSDNPQTFVHEMATYEVIDSGSLFRLSIVISFFQKMRSRYAV